MSTGIEKCFMDWPPKAPIILKQKPVPDKGAMARVVQPFSNRLIDNHEVDFPVDPATENKERSTVAEPDLTTAIKCHVTIARAI
jgi:hypothetical protein